MSKLTCFIDGSESITKKTIRQGWGIVARHTIGQTVEINGFIDYPGKNKNVAGFFELLAFYHAVNHAEENNIYPEDVSFYTDCAFVGYAGFNLVRQNRSKQKKSVITRLIKFQKLFCANDKHAVMKLVRWLAYAQIHWVKGHSRIIDNCRADYLARIAVHKKEAMPFSEWILNGFTVFDYETKNVIQWHPPFSKTIE